MPIRHVTLIPLLAVFKILLLTGAHVAEGKQQDFAQIRDHALLADATYKDKASIDDASTRQGYVLDHHGTLPDIEVSYFLATDNAAKKHIIAVRGTANIDNALVDVKFKLRLDDRTNVRLHRGFVHAATGIYQDVREHLEQDYEISTTGHSLGGAVAMILAMYLDTDQYSVGQVITFGQPKVTTISGARKYKHLKIVRVVTPNDVVPLVPPLAPTDSFGLSIYWHLGTEVILLSGKKYSILEGRHSMLRATAIPVERPSPENIQHHRMLFYLERLEAKIDDAMLVPHKGTNLDIFDFE